MVQNIRANGHGGTIQPSDGDEEPGFEVLRRQAAAELNHVQLLFTAPWHGYFGPGNLQSGKIGKCLKNQLAPRLPLGVKF